jgi:hypothetical protein
MGALGLAPRAESGLLPSFSGKATPFWLYIYVQCVHAFPFPTIADTGTGCKEGNGPTLSP